MPRDYRSAERRKREREESNHGSRRTHVARLIVAAIVLFTFGILFSFKEILFPFFVAGIIAYILGPAVEKTTAKGVPRVISVFGILIASFLSATVFFYSFFPQFSEEGQEGIVRIQQFLDDAPELYEVFEGEIKGWVAGDEKGEKGGNTMEAQLSPPVPPEEVLESGIQPSGNRERAHVLIEPLEDGSYGVSFRESSFEFEHSSGGGFRLTPRPLVSTKGTLSGLRQDVVTNITHAIEGFGSKLMNGFIVLGRSVITGLLGAFVGIMITFMVAGFLLLEMPQIRKFFRGLVPPKHNEAYEELLTSLNDGLSGVVRGQILICGVNGCLSFIGFLIFIPKYAFVMAMLAAVMSLIPIFGTIISSVPVVLVGLSVSLGTALGVFFWILGIHFIEGNFLNPTIIGNAAKINPVIIIFALIAGEHAFGIPGALLAVPVTSVLLTCISFVYRRIQPNVF